MLIKIKNVRSTRRAKQKKKINGRQIVVIKNNCGVWTPPSGKDGRKCKNLDDGLFGFSVKKVNLAHVKDKIHFPIHVRLVVGANTGNKRIFPGV